MKKILVIYLLVILGLTACNNGFLGEPTAKPASWEFIQSVGGIKLGDLYSRDGRTFVSLLVDVSGNQAITVTPTLNNTGLICSSGRIVGSGNFVLGMDMWLTIYVEPEQGVFSSRRGSKCNDIVLPAVPMNGFTKYRIFYIEKPAPISTIFNSRANLIGVVDL